MIAEETLEDTVRAVRAVPAEQRRIMLYTGVHPHEGTTRLAKPHESRWAKYGVLHVAHPKDSTPHAIWRRHEVNCQDGFVPLDYSVRMVEEEFTQQIAPDAMTISFHGTDYRGLDTIPLEIFVPAINTGNHRKLYNGLLESFPNTFPDDLLLAGSILVEYNYMGYQVDVVDPFFQMLIDRTVKMHAGKQISVAYHADDDMYSKGCIDPSYMGQRKLKPSDINEFHDTHVKTMDKLIEVCSNYLK